MHAAPIEAHAAMRATSPRAFAFALAAIVIGAVLVRLAWLNSPSFIGEPLLTSSDGYRIGLAVDALFTGDNGRLLVPSPLDHGLVALVALGRLVAPGVLEWVMFLLPALLGALVAIPMALVARELLGGAWALAAAAILSVAPAFAARTSAGFLDTDPFALGVPLVALAFLVRAAMRDDSRQALHAALVIAAGRWLYDQGDPLGLAIALTAIAFFYVRRAFSTVPGGRAELARVAAVLGLALIDLPWFVRTPIVLVAWLALGRLPGRTRLYAGIALALVGLVMSVAWRSLLHKLGVYALDSGSTEGVVTGETIIFGNVTAFIDEAKKEPLLLLAERMSGSIATLVLGLAGFGLLVWRQPAALLLLPLAAVGGFAVLGGARFAMYLSPVLALGLAALGAFISGRIDNEKRAVRLIVAFTFVLAALAPALHLSLSARPRLAVIPAEVQLMRELGARLAPGDVVLSWWDEGYALGYFARARTIIDGSRRGDEAGLVAELLLQPSQAAAANLARRLAETQARLAGTDRPVAQNVYLDAEREGVRARDLPTAMVTLPRPVATRDVYLYLPLRLFDDLPSLSLLRPRAPDVAPPRRAHVVVSAGARADGERLYLPSGHVVDGREVAVTNGSTQGAQRPLKGLVAVRGVGPEATAEALMRRPRAPTTGLWFDASGVFVEVDDAMFASTFVQLVGRRVAEPSAFAVVMGNAAGVVVRVSR